MVAVQQAGYKLGSDRTNYPEGIQAAEARLNPQQNVAAADDRLRRATGCRARIRRAGQAKTGWQVKRIADDAPIYKVVNGAAASAA